MRADRRLCDDDEDGGQAGRRILNRSSFSSREENTSAAFVCERVSEFAEIEVVTRSEEEEEGRQIDLRQVCERSGIGASIDRSIDRQAHVLLYCCSSYSCR